MVYDFGFRLRDLRKSKHMTQAQVAKRLNLSKTTISGYENNVKTPSLEVLTQLSILYDVSSDYILGLEHRKMLHIDGLTDSQQELVSAILAELKKSIKTIKKNGTQ